METRHTMILRMGDKEDLSVWDDFVGFYWDVITGWAKYFGCSDALAEDVFQEVCMNLISSFSYDADNGKFRPWLKTLVHRRAVDALRKENKQRNVRSQKDFKKDREEGVEFSADDAKVLADLESFEDANAALDSFADDQVWLKSLLKQCLRSLYESMEPVVYKSFVSYVLEGRSGSEVASRLGISEDLVYQYKTRSLKALEKIFLEFLENTGDSELAALQEESSHNLESLIDHQLKGNQSSKAKSLRAVLADIISGYQSYKVTAVISEAPDSLVERLAYIRSLVQRYPKPEGLDAAILVIDVGVAKWLPLAKNLQFGRDLEDGSESIALKAAGVSGLHAQVKEDTGQYILEDLMSTNGTYLNAEPVTEAQVLSNGDIIQIQEATLICSFF